MDYKVIDFRIGFNRRHFPEYLRSAGIHNYSSDIPSRAQVGCISVWNRVSFGVDYNKELKALQSMGFTYETIDIRETMFEVIFKEV